MVRITERVLDAQFRLFETVNERSEQAMTLCAGVLVGGLGLLTILGERTPGAYSPCFFLFVGIGATGSVAAFCLLALGGMMKGTKMDLGADIAKLAKGARNHDFGLPELQMSYLKEASGWRARNSTRLAEAVAWRKRGLGTLAIAIFAFGVALFMLLVAALPTSAA